MPPFFHERPDARELFSTLAAERGIPEPVVEKDYWLMHCLWGLQQNGLAFELKGGTSLSKGWGVIDRFSEDVDIRFDPPTGLNVRSESEAHIEARRRFFGDLAARIRIPGVVVERNRAFDDERAQNGGISLKYPAHFAPMPQLRPEVLLEAGFARTQPNEPRDFSSWAYDRAVGAGLEVVDNRAPAVRCFNPEYTFVDKLQTVCRRYRQHCYYRHLDRNRPREFLRHYYDLYKLLEQPRVLDFMRTSAYEEYKEEKLRGADLTEFTDREAFMLSDEATYQRFKEEYDSARGLILGPAPTFDEIVGRIRQHAESL